jgi:signal transduction histidine kinase/ActR/RegA family two-component response regulator
LEQRFIRKDGTTLWGEVSVSGIWDSKGRCERVVGLISDMTQRRNLEAQLLQAQKMEAVGTLAGGIAHDFNNLLQAVLGYSEILIERHKSDSADLEELRRIHTAGKRGAGLIRNLLAFSRKVQPKLSIVDLDREVMEIQKLLFHTIPKTIKIVVRSTDYLHTINADASQVGQILMNLAVNARDAMPEGGTLRIETENILLEDAFCRIHPEVQPGDYVLLTVSDTGHGMDAQTVERIFDPFFSTKEVGKGTGLGLATVYGIVKQHNGYISCYSEPGKGTVFKIYFPAIKRKDMAETTEEQFEPRGGSETILLADDELILRDLGKNILANLGYHVLEAADGQEALEIYKEHRRTISLVLLDLNMPKLNGERCLTEILKLDPDARVLVATGLLEHEIKASIINRGASGFVSKPYSTRKLLSQVREILDRNTGS